VNQKSEESEKKCRKLLTIQHATRGATMRMTSEYTTHSNNVEMQQLIARCLHSTATDLHIPDTDRQHRPGSTGGEGLNRL